MTRPIQILSCGRLTFGCKGISGRSFSNGLLYSQCIAQAGAVSLAIAPVTENIPLLKDLVASADGVLIQGGGDIDPLRYGEPQRVQSLYGIEKNHDELELALVRETVSQDKPLLAICRGAQVLNVALGGSLYQDLTEMPLDSLNHWNSFHTVLLDDGCRIAKSMGTRRPRTCHSWHHQALREIAADLCVVGRTTDGVVEAVEHTKRRWIVGVQWHPEANASTEPEQQGIFNNFIRACGSRTQI